MPPATGANQQIVDGPKAVGRGGASGEQGKGLADCGIQSPPRSSDRWPPGNTAAFKPRAEGPDAGAILWACAPNLQASLPSDTAAPGSPSGHSPGHVPHRL